MHPGSSKLNDRLHHGSKMGPRAGSQQSPPHGQLVLWGLRHELPEKEGVQPLGKKSWSWSPCLLFMIVWHRAKVNIEPSKLNHGHAWRWVRMDCWDTQMPEMSAIKSNRPKKLRPSTIQGEVRRNQTIQNSLQRAEWTGKVRRALTEETLAYGSHQTRVQISCKL